MNSNMSLLSTNFYDKGYPNRLTFLSKPTFLPNHVFSMNSLIIFSWSNIKSFTNWLISSIGRFGALCQGSPSYFRWVQVSGADMLVRNNLYCALNYILLTNSVPLCDWVTKSLKKIDQNLYFIILTMERFTFGQNRNKDPNLSRLFLKFHQ